MNLKKYVQEHLSDPIYLAAQDSIKGKEISLEQQEKILNAIFLSEEVKNKQRLNIMLPILVDLKISGGLFYKNLQNRFENLDNKIISTVAFKSLAEQRQELDKFNLYKVFGMYLERDKFYQQLTSNNYSIAYTYSRLISKIKDALFDVSSYPYPYTNQNNRETGIKIAQNLNLNLLKNIKSIFKYSNIGCRHIILDAFIPDIKLLTKHKNENKYFQILAENIYTIHPNYFKYLEDEHNISLPRHHKMAYLAHNAANLNNEQFSFFAAAFKTQNVDDDILGDLVLDGDYTSQFDETKRKQFDENMNYFVNIPYLSEIKQQENIDNKNNQSKTKSNNTSPK